jgi:hypothetical protein
MDHNQLREVTMVGKDEPSPGDDEDDDGEHLFFYSLVLENQSMGVLVSICMADDHHSRQCHSEPLQEGKLMSVTKRRRE